MDPPSSLPGFRALADRLADDALKSRPGDDDKNLDEYLERLAKEGVEVHQRARQIFGDPTSQPNPIHHDLLRLFRSPEAVRLVTTNFDPHFTTAAHEVFGGDTLDVYRAAALPPGHAFSGIVYLHGCVDKASSRLIITAKDFGEAYITERWATNFLIRMFDEWTVLFVGYSHDDILMQYLSRALSHRAQPRFALTHRDGDKWSDLGITPILYPKSGTAPEHGELHDAIARWSRRANMGLLDHDQEIAAIVAAAPPVDPVQLDYIFEALTEEPLTRLFIRHARDLGWLQILEERQEFQALWQPGLALSASSRLLAHWFAEHFAVQHDEEALAVYQRRGQTPHPELVFAILFYLQRDPRPSPTTFGRWIAILLAGTEPPPYTEYFDYALTKCAWPDDRDAALLLFEYLTSPRLKMKPGFGHLVGGAGHVGFDLVAIGKEYWIRDQWEKLFRPNMADCALDVARLVTHHLMLAHRLYRAGTGAA